MPSAEPRRGLVLFAHGARDPAWAAPVHALAQAVARQAPAWAVRVAFLELLPPTLPAVLTELAPHCDQIAVLPVFWAAAGHVRNELPALIASADTQAAQVRVLPVLSELPGLLDFVAGSAVALAARSG